MTKAKRMNMPVLSVLISDSLCLSRLWEPVLLKKEKTNYAGWSLRSVIKKMYFGVVLLPWNQSDSFLTHFYRHAFQVWHKNPNITILGNHKARRLPIFSMLIYHQDSGKFLHHNFVSVLLNDLYGIPARGGCACAGPYAQVTEMDATVSSLCLVTFVPYCASLNEWSSWGWGSVGGSIALRWTAWTRGRKTLGTKGWLYGKVRHCSWTGPLTENKRVLLTYSTYSLKCSILLHRQFTCSTLVSVFVVVGNCIIQPCT